MSSLHAILRFAPDVASARRRTRLVAERVGLPLLARVRLATAVSEVARCALADHGGGGIDFTLEGSSPRRMLAVTITAEGAVVAAGPGSAGAEVCADGGADALKLAGSLVDEVERRQTTSGDPVAVLRMRLPVTGQGAGDELLRRLGDELEAQGPDDPYEEIQRQNQELTRVLEKLQERNEELHRLNAEVERTNRGVVALHAELEEKAQSLERANVVITRIANTDALTGLPNRRSFTEALTQGMSFVRRHGGELAVIAFDLDGFKDVNDSLGHEAGDQVLCAFAAVLEESCRQEDTPSRLGGDEFWVMLPATGLAGARALAERIREATRALPETHARGVTVSCGVAAWLAGDDATGLLHRADRALYAAKRAGRDQVASDDGDAAGS